MDSNVAEEPKTSSSNSMISLSSDSSHQQDWSLPESIIHYIAKNPSSPKLYEKLIRSCKYFASQNPILVLEDLSYDDSKKWTLNQSSINANAILLKVNETNMKLWITKNLSIACKKSSYAVSTMMNFKFYRHDYEYLHLALQTLPVSDLSLLGSSCKTCSLDRVTVTNGKTFITIADVVKCFPKLKQLYYVFRDYENASSPVTKELIKHLCSSKISLIDLRNIPQSFGIGSFFGYIKTNKTADVRLFFSKLIPDYYIVCLNGIVNSMIRRNFNGFRPPYFGFPTFTKEEEKKQFYLFKNYFDYKMSCC